MARPLAQACRQHGWMRWPLALTKNTRSEYLSENCRTALARTTRCSTCDGRGARSHARSSTAARAGSATGDAECAADFAADFAPPPLAPLAPSDCPGRNGARRATAEGRQQPQPQHLAHEGLGHHMAPDEQGAREALAVLPAAAGLGPRPRGALRAAACARGGITTESGEAYCLALTSIRKRLTVMKVWQSR